jgi:2-C-methyl-D-erythritol 4-phosphate cytidylyltransferase
MLDTYGSIGVILIGAGNSVRMGKDKIFSPLQGKELITWSLDVFQNFNLITQIVLVLNEQNIHQGNQLISSCKWSKITSLCLGGNRRQDSVNNGLGRLSGCKWVIVHDAARPFISDELIAKGLEAAQETGSAVAAIPVNNTIKLVDEDSTIISTLNRSQLWSIQTPQIFRFDILSKAYSSINTDVTDDAALVELAGYKVKIFPGSDINIKITTPDDLVIAEAIAKGIK